MIMSETLDANKTKKKRIIYLDYLRALAIIAVILFHIFKRVGFMAVPGYSIMPSFSWWITDFLGTCCRCGVDIFLMLSGALSLGRDWDIKSFLGKRIPRIVGPFLFWGILIAILVLLIPVVYPRSLIIFNDFGFTHFEPITGAWTFLWYLRECLLGDNKWFGQYWFFWMILGTYLIMPIFNRWLKGASMKEVEYFLVLWLITCIFEKSVLWQFPVRLTYFAGPIGMVVAGYYLRHTDREVFTSLRNSIIILLIGMVSAMITSYFWSSPNEIYYFSRYSLFVALESIGLFLVYRNIDTKKMDIFQNKDGFLRKSSFTIAKYSYGIYLIHLFILLLLMIVFLPHLPYPVTVVLLFVGTLGLSIVVMAIFNRIPYVNKVIGAK